MGEYHFRPSTDENANKTVLIALSGTTGSGKTESAMRLATGIVGSGGKFCVIDTENRRALNKKGRYNFDHLDLKAPYSPDNFKGALEAAEKAGYKAIVVDNFSHEWFGEGGCSDLAEEALERMSRGDPGKAERLTALSWKGPKQSHKKLMYRILQCAVPVIFCLRAEPKIKFVKDQNGKTQVIDAGWQPIAEKMFGYEMLIYALLMPENPGVPVHLKKLEPEFESMLPLGKQITEEAGKKLAEWAKGDETKQPQKQEVSPPETDPDRMGPEALKLAQLLMEKYDKDKPKMAYALKVLTTWDDKDGKHHDGMTTLKGISEKMAQVTRHKFETWLKKQEGCPANDAECDRSSYGDQTFALCEGLPCIHHKPKE